VKTPASIAITGLDTFLGRNLAERLLERERPPRIVGLDLRLPLRLEGRVGFHRVDLTDPVADRTLATILAEEGVDTLVHLAFRSGPTADIEYDHELEALGSHHVLNASAAAKVSRFVLASSTSVYGPHADNPNFLDESHELRGHRDAHCVQNRVEVERLVAGWRARHPDTEVCVLRHCWVMGPSYSDEVVRFFERSAVPVLLGYDPLLQFVHEDDLLRVFERAALESHPGVYNIVGTGVVPLSTLLALGDKRSLPMPPALFYRVANYPSQGQTGDPPAGFYDYLRYLWVAAGERGWSEFGRPVYSTKEAWISFVSSRRMRGYR